MYEINSVTKQAVLISIKSLSQSRPITEVRIRIIATSDTVARIERRAVQALS